LLDIIIKAGPAIQAELCDQENDPSAAFRLSAFLRRASFYKTGQP
jgi:hypothetical protein